MSKKIKLQGVTEYSENLGVEIDKTDGLYVYGKVTKTWEGHGRLVIKAFNEGGHNHVQIDLLQLIAWLKKNKPELLNQA